MQAPAPAPDRLATWFPGLAADATRADLERAVLEGLSRADADPTRARMHAAIEAGAWETARDLLSELVAKGEIERGARLLADGDAPAALSVLERALTMQPRGSENADARLLRAEAAFRVGRANGERELVLDARATFLAVAREHSSAEAWLGASRASRWLGSDDEALEHARAGMEARKAAGATALVLPRAPIPQRVLAEASVVAANAARAADAGSAWERRYFEEARSALEALLARAPTDAWTWNELARVHTLHGEHAEAERVALLGLEWNACDAALCSTLADAARARGGNATRIEVFDRLAKLQPDCALAPWYSAEARWSEAVERYLVNEDSRALFAAAETAFARCRALDATHDRACREYEATCRAGAGWCAWRAGEIEAAQAAFLSVEELYPGALATEVPGRLGAAVLGLDLVGAAWAERGADAARPEAIHALERAGRVYEFLRRAQPEVARWANNAGFFHRDTAVAMRDRAHALFAADASNGAEANRMVARAKELAEESFAAYLEAARLAPEDVRVVNDTALILVYYLQRDHERARTLLESARAAGERQLPEARARLAADGLAETERDALRIALEELENGLGDVYQNLGVLALEHDGDPKAALAWFERALVTGPDPREEVRGETGFLQRCKHAIEHGTSTRLVAADRWDAPLARPNR